MGKILLRVRKNWLKVQADIAVLEKHVESFFFLSWDALYYLDMPLEKETREMSHRRLLA